MILCSDGVLQSKHSCQHGMHSALIMKPCMLHGVVHGGVHAALHGCLCTLNRQMICLLQMKKLRSLRSLRVRSLGLCISCCIYTWIMLAAYATCDDYPHNAYPWRFLNFKIYCCLGSTPVSYKTMYHKCKLLKHTEHDFIKDVFKDDCLTYYNCDHSSREDP